jgi:hypothetical protein
MMLDDALLNIIKGADADDDEDIAIRQSLYITLRERGFAALRAAAADSDARNVAAYDRAARWNRPAVGETVH